tara:strand:- start:47531 stop:48547 length:1017 start_codon:yes stop_codon:yes gene_type:complete
MSLTANIAIFAMGTIAIWIAGTLLARYADEISRRTGLGHVLVGVFLLAGVTSLPEIATSFSAASAGESRMAVNNLLGSIAMQVAVLAIGDLLISRHALTYIAPDPALMLQGSLNLVLLSVVAMAIVSGDREFFGAGVWTWGLLVGVLYSFFKLGEANQRKPWVANFTDDEEPEGASDAGEKEARVSALAPKTLACAVVILVAGFCVARTAAAIAAQTAISSSFMGMAFLAIATSLPEASTVFAALRRRLYAMAISDILGTNILNIVLIFGIDIVADKSPVLNEVGSFSVLGALLGLLVTAVLVMGLAERKDRQFLGMGIDSLLILVFYLGGMTLLYRL